MTEIDLADGVRDADSEIEVEFVVELTAEAKPVFTAQVLTWACCLFEAIRWGDHRLRAPLGRDLLVQPFSVA